MLIFRCLRIGIVFVLMIVTSCDIHNKQKNSPQDDKNEIINVLTVYGPTTYYSYRGEEFGFDYENLKRFVSENNLKINLTVVGSLSELLDSIKTEKFDLVACPVPNLLSYKSFLEFCGPSDTTWQVIAHKKSIDKLNDVTSLVGKTIYVTKDSKYHNRLQNLNEELGGDISIAILDKDSLIEEDLLQMIDNDEIEYAVVDNKTGILNKTYFPDIDFGLKISHEQISSWGVNKNNRKLINLLEDWNNSIQNSNELNDLYKKYFESSKTDNTFDNINSLLSNNNNAVKEYSPVFKKYGREYNVDWRLIAAIAYVESGFNPFAKSPFGATGLMQVMPISANSVGVNPQDLMNVDSNVKAGTKIFNSLLKTFSKNINDSTERIKFALAAYNSGLGHISDARKIADKVGLDNSRWFGNVSFAALLKSRPKYYNDKDIRNGYFNARETVNFVERVLDTYDIIRKNFKE